MDRNAPPGNRMEEKNARFITRFGTLSGRIT